MQEAREKMVAVTKRLAAQGFDSKEMSALVEDMDTLIDVTKARLAEA